MALIRQNIPVGLYKGVDSQSDPKQLEGSFVLLENGVFESRGRIRKRNGYEALSSTVVNATDPASASLSYGRGLATYNGELVLFDDDTVYSYDEGSPGFVAKGLFASVDVRESPVIRNTYEQTRQDGSRHASGLEAFAWEDSQGGVRYSVKDGATGQHVVANALLDASGSSPKVVAAANELLVYYLVNGLLKVAVIPVAAPTRVPFSVALTPVSGGDAVSGVYDVTVDGATLYVAYAKSGGVKCFRYENTNVTLPTYTHDIAAGTVSALTVIAAGQGPHVVYSDGTTLRYKAFDPTFSSELGSGIIETIAGVTTVTGSAKSTGDVQVFYSVAGNVRTAVIGKSPAPFRRGVGLATKSFVNNDRVYVTVAYDSPLQATYFVASEEGRLVAKLLSGLAGAAPTTGPLPEAREDALTLLCKDTLYSDGGELHTNTGVESVHLAFDAPFGKAVLGDTLHLAGGFLQMYDSVSPVEHGFHVFPEGVTVETFDTGGELAEGQYQYVVCYEWFDNRGNVHRSAPSPAVTVTTTGTTTSATITVPTLRLTEKQGERAPVLIVVYRTLVNQQNFYQVTSVSNPVKNDPSVDSVTITDTLSDDTLQGNAYLYTTGGVIENIAPPAVAALTVHRNRIFLVDATNRLQLYFSKIVSPGSPVEFSDTFTLNVDPRGGEVTALASLDDKLVVFKKTSIFAITGEGPDATGNQNDFSDAQLVSTDAGCLNPRSVVQVPQGIMFESEKGIYILGRDLSVTFIGQEVQAYTDAANVTSAELIPNVREVRFTMDSGITLVYNYNVGLWAVFTGLSAADSAIYGGRFTYLTPAGAVLKETIGSYSDAGSFIKLRLRTGWMNFAGLAGFARAYEFALVGEYRSPHALRIGIAYDFDPAIAQTVITTPASGGALFGLDSPYGASAFGGSYPDYRHRIFLARQKLTSIQLTIEDVFTNTAGESYTLSSLTFDVGAKRGLGKKPAVQNAS